jgi:hypothetical protein
LSCSNKQVAANQGPKLTGAAIPVFASFNSVQAAPAAWPSVSGQEFLMAKSQLNPTDLDFPTLVAQSMAELRLKTELQSFFEGVDGHEKGAKIWNDSLDESK